MKKHFTFILMLLVFGWRISQAQQILTGSISSDMTLTSDKIWLLQGYVYVTNGATLTIQPGTIIKGDSITLGSLIITRGSKINALGTVTSPIVFTSANLIGERRRGDWGGLILLGNATVNWPGDTGHVEGITPNPNTLYGGGATPNDGDNSGTLQYVRIEFAGIALSPNNEINGLTMGGVGSGTTIDHVQVSYSNDDSYEWFGGTVHCKYIVAYDGIDDDFDTDNGFSGRVQFALGMRDPNVADVSGSKTFESDFGWNNRLGANITPRSSSPFATPQTMTAGFSLPGNFFGSSPAQSPSGSFPIPDASGLTSRMREQQTRGDDFRKLLTGSGGINPLATGFDPINLTVDSTRQALNPVTAPRIGEMPPAGFNAVNPLQGVGGPGGNHSTLLGDQNAKILGPSSLSPAVSAPTESPLIQSRPAVAEFPRRRF